MIFENASLFFKKLKKFLLCPCFSFPDLLTAEFPRCRIRVFWKSSRRGPLFPRGNMCRRHTGKAVAQMKSGGIRVRQQYAHKQDSSALAKRRHTGKAVTRMKSGGIRVRQAVRTQARQQRTGEAAATGKTKAAVSRRAARNSGGSDCPCAQPSGFVLRCSARGSSSRAVLFGRFGKGAPPGYALSVCAARHVCRTVACGISFPCLQFSARIFSSSSCR